jgi:hypothetical protein
MLTSFLRGIGVMPSLKDSVRTQQLRLKSEARTLEMERMQLRRDVQRMEARIQIALDHGETAVALSLARTRQRLVRVDAAKASKVADLTMLQYEVASIASIETDHRMMAGVGQIAQQQTSQLKVNRIVKQQRDTNRALQQLRDSQAVVREAMDELVAGDEADVGAASEDRDAQQYIDELQLRKADIELLHAMPVVPSGVPGASASSTTGVAVSVGPQGRRTQI